MKVVKTIAKHLAIHAGLYWVLHKRRIPSATALGKVADASEKWQQQLFGKYLNKRNRRWGSRRG